MPWSWKVLAHCPLQQSAGQLCGDGQLNNNEAWHLVFGFISIYSEQDRTRCSTVIEENCGVWQHNTSACVLRLSFEFFMVLSYHVPITCH